MIQIHTVVYIIIYFYFFTCNAFNTGSKQEKYEVILNDVYDCPEPYPPYSKNRRILPNYTVNTLKGKRYLTGYTTITTATPFSRFSARTFFINNTNRELKMQVTGVSCKNIIARAIIALSNISYTQKNCILKQGRYQYANLDLNKVLHALPNWHGAGQVLHQLQILFDGATEFCEEVSTTIKLG